MYPHPEVHTVCVYPCSRYGQVSNVLQKTLGHLPTGRVVKLSHSLWAPLFLRSSPTRRHSFCGVTFDKLCAHDARRVDAGYSGQPTWSIMLSVTQFDCCPGLTRKSKANLTRVATFHSSLHIRRADFVGTVAQKEPVPSPPADSFLVCCFLSLLAWTRTTSRAAVPRVGRRTSGQGKHSIRGNVHGPLALGRRGSRRRCDGGFVSLSLISGNSQPLVRSLGISSILGVAERVASRGRQRLRKRRVGHMRRAERRVQRYPCRDTESKSSQVARAVWSVASLSGQPCVPNIASTVRLAASLSPGV